MTIEIKDIKMFNKIIELYSMYIDNKEDFFINIDNDTSINQKKKDEKNSSRLITIFSNELVKNNNNVRLSVGINVKNFQNILKGLSTDPVYISFSEDKIIITYNGNNFKDVRDIKFLYKNKCKESKGDFNNFKEYFSIDTNQLGVLLKKNQNIKKNKLTILLGINYLKLFIDQVNYSSISISFGELKDIKKCFKKNLNIKDTEILIKLTNLSKKIHFLYNINEDSVLFLIKNQKYSMYYIFK